MTEALIGLGLSKLLLSAAVGLLAFALHHRGRDPALAHRLWVLTLIAAITPPVLVLSVPALPALVAVGPAGTSAAAASGAAVAPSAGSWLAANLLYLLVAVWLAGSLVFFAVSTQRIIRFGRLLGTSCRPASPKLQHATQLVAYELGMRTVPSVHLSAARLAPMTWWSGGRVRVILPEALRDEVDDAQLRWILAHELAHIKRRDHLVRWLEWLASVVFWWNPVVWWARRNLRRDEEDACDALVLEHLQGQPRAYARTLLAVVEVMATPTGAAPTLATGIDAARSLEHRLTRIVSLGRGQRAPRIVAAGTVAAGLLLMSVGVSGHDQQIAPIADADAVAVAVPMVAASGSATPTVGTAPSASPSAVPLEGTKAAAVNMLRVSGDIAPDAILIGTSAADAIAGTGADESLKGHAGADRLGGGPGRDSIDGGPGADIIRGGAGADTLNGGPGRDIIGGGAGADKINGGAGDDIIQGGAGRDSVAAGAGDDIVRVWADGTPDIVDCGSGDDRAVIGSTDIASDCETVVVRDPA